MYRDSVLASLLSLKAVALAGALLTTVCSPSAHALSLRSTTPEQVLAKSDMIAVGTVTDVSARYVTPDQVMIATDYRVRLDEVVHDPQKLFGAKSAGGEIVLSFAGGQIGTKAVRIPGVPEFKTGEQAVFFLNGEELKSIVPLTGATHGLYRTFVGPDGRKLVSSAGCCNNAAHAVTKGFFPESAFKSTGYTLDEFVAEIKRGLPVAKSRPELIQSDDVAVPKGKEHLIFTGDAIPQQRPEHGTKLVDTVTTAEAAKDPARPAPAPLPPSVSVQPSTEKIVAGSVLPSQGGEKGDKYRFLWGTPSGGRTFDIPPSWYVSTPWGPNFEYSESDWNVYASGVFNRLATGDETFGNNDRNDVAFTNSATFQTAYGFAMPANLLGIAMMFNSSDTNISAGQGIVESDVIFNVSQPWTLDWMTAYNSNGSTNFFRATAIHEIGHTFGREHTFTENSSAFWNSVMNYVPGGALDAEFWKPFADDAASMRAAYPASSVSLTDMGIYQFYTAGFVPAGGTGVATQWATFPSSVVAGSSFTLTDYMVENLGTTTQSPQVNFYLVPAQQNFTGGHYCSSSSLGSFPGPSLSKVASSIAVPASVPPGLYYIAATLNASDANDWNKSAWSNTRITVQAPPAISLSTTVLWPGVMLGQNASSQTFNVTNTGSGTLNYSVSDNVSWLSVSPSSGSSTGESDIITVTYSTSGLAKGTYDGTITVTGNATNSPRTIAVTLTVMAPTIQRSTSSLSPTVAQGSNAASQSFTVRNSGDGTLNYSITDNVSWLSVSPETGSSTGESDTITVSYSTSGLAAGAYDATISIGATGASNTPLTISVALIVNPPAAPLIDNFGNRGALSGSASSSPGNNTYATAEAGEPAHNTGMPAAKSLWWKWTAPANGMLSITASGNFSRLLAVYTGSSVASLTQLHQTYAMSSDTAAIPAFFVTAGTEYQIAVDGWRSCLGCTVATGDATAFISFAQAAPSIGRTPTSLSFSGVAGGSNPASQTFDIRNAVQGSGAMSYTLSADVSWLTFSTPASGSSTATTAGAGPYNTHTAYVSVAGLGAGTHSGNILVTSAQATNSPQSIPVTLTVSAAAPAPSIGFSPSSFSFAAATGGPNPASQNLGIYNATAGSGAMYYSIAKSYKSGEPTGWMSIAPVAGLSTAGAGFGQVVFHTVSVNSAALAAGTYHGYLTTAAPGATNSPRTLAVTLTVTTPVPANNAFAGAIAISGNSGTTTGTNVGATRQGGEPATVGGAAGSHSVWWKWTAPWTGTLKVNTTGSNFDTLLGIYTGSLGSLAMVQENDDSSSLQSSVVASVTAGTTYYILVDGKSGATGAVTLSWSRIVPPVVAPIGDASIAPGSPYTGPTPSLTQGASPITWTLLDGPGGMTINASSGVVSWPSPLASPDPFPVTIRASNAAGHDNESWQLTVTSPCTYYAEPINAAFGANAVASTVEVYTESGCGWTAASNAEWVTITSGAAGSGPGTVNYTVAVNETYETRFATITVAGHEHQIAQGGRHPASAFKAQQKTKVSSDGGGWQEVIVNYTTSELSSSPYQSTSGSVSYPMILEQWMGVYHYDYATGRFSEAVYRVKMPL